MSNNNDDDDNNNNTMARTATDNENKNTYISLRISFPFPQSLTWDPNLTVTREMPHRTAPHPLTPSSRPDPTSERERSSYEVLSAAELTQMLFITGLEVLGQAMPEVFHGSAL